MIRILLFFITLIVLSSCGTISRFEEDDEEVLVNRGIYPATQWDVMALSADTSGMFGDLALMMMPLVILDVPISLIVDTVMLPYDIGMYAYNSHYLGYWEDVSANKKIEMPMAEYLPYYNETGSVAMLSVSRKYDDEDLLKFYFDVSSANDEWLKTSSNMINTLAVRADSQDKYTSLRTYTCNAIASNLTNKKYGRAINAIIEGKRYSTVCIENMAEHGLSCRSLVRSNKIPEMHIRKCFQEDPERYSVHLSKLSSTPIDIQNSMYDHATVKLSALQIPLDKVAYSDNSFNVLQNIAGVTKDGALIRKLFYLNSEKITSRLLYNPAVPLEYKLTNKKFLLNHAMDEKSTTKEELINLISKYSDNKEFLLSVARGKRIDIDVYDALMKHTPSNTRTDVYNAIIYNRDAQNKDVLFKLVLRDDTKMVIEPKAYKDLLVKTETPQITVLNYGVLEFIVDHPERYKKSALLTPERLPGEWVVKKDKTNNIKIEKGLKFGLMFKMTKELSSDSSKILTKITPPDGSTEKLIKQLDKQGTKTSTPDLNDVYVKMYSFDSDWEMVPGDWEFEISHQGKALSKITFHLYN